MKTLKIASLVLFLLLASALLVTSCDSQDDTPTPEPTAISGVFASVTPGDSPAVMLPTPTETLPPVPTATLPPPPTDTPAPPPTNTATSAAPTQDPNCLNAAYVADVTIPDNTRIEAGQEFVKTWRVRNNGTCPWPPETGLAFESGDSLGAAASADVGVLEIDQTTDISVRMVAPTADGSYKGVWRFSGQNGKIFGTYLTVVIQVGVPTPTSPAQPTATGAPTVPPEPSPTLEPGQPTPTTAPSSPTPPPPPSPTPPPPPPGGQPVGLNNGNFEADWSQQSSHRCLMVPVGGGPFHLDVGNIFTPPGWICWFVHQEGEWAQPEGRDSRARDPDRMRSGSKGYVNFTFHRKHDAGLYQQVSVAPGTKLQFTAWPHAWSNHADSDRPDAFPHPDDARWSDGAGYERVGWPEGSQPPTGDPQVDARTNFTFWVGIDPSGGINPLAGTVVWSQGWHVYNGFVQPVSVQATAQSGTVTVFLRSRTKWPFKHNDAYWDDAELIAIP